MSCQQCHKLICQCPPPIIIKDDREAISLREQLAASQAREQQLREALQDIRSHATPTGCQLASKVLPLPQDDTALKQWGAKLLRDAAMHSSCFDKMQFFVSYLNRMADELDPSSEVMKGRT